ncbi:MAG: hypothetical protein RI894_1448 [Bacteroidota bacterium]|jgi:tetratricopeptide (TPR) repeat protein
MSKFLSTASVLACIFALFCDTAQAQQSVFADPTLAKISWRKAFALGNEFFTKKDYSKAFDYYQYAAAKHPQDARINYAAGMSAIGQRDYASAKKYLLDAQSGRFTKKVPLAKMQYGIALKQRGEYTKAIEVLDAFAKAYRNKEDSIYQSVLEHIKGCSNGMYLARRKSNGFLVQNMGDKINTPGNDKSGTANRDKFLYATVSGNATALKTMNSDGKVTTLNEQEAEVNSPYLADDGKTVFFTRSIKLANGDQRTQIYTATIDAVKNTLINPQPLGRTINGAETETWSATDPVLAKNDRLQDVLYYSSNRPGTEGGYDIWVSTRKADGSFGESRNLGRQINSNFDDISPFYDTKNQRLYFSTNRPETSGGFDVYAANGFGRYWKKPINLGQPINSPADDYLFRLNTDGLTGILTSNRAGTMTLTCEGCTDDIFSVAIISNPLDANSPDGGNIKLTKMKLTGSILDKKTNIELKGYQISLLEVIDGNPVLVDQITSTDGSYEFTLDVDKVYVVEAEANDIRVETFLIDPTDFKNEQEVTRDILVSR